LPGHGADLAVDLLSGAFLSITAGAVLEITLKPYQYLWLNLGLTHDI